MVDFNKALLQDKLRKVEALIKGAASEGERAAANAAAAKLRERIGNAPAERQYAPPPVQPRAYAPPPPPPRQGGLGALFEMIDEIFREGGVLHRAGGEYRKSQYDLALAIARAFQSHLCGMYEGPTGTGKTFAYLTSAILYALCGYRVVIAVSTNALLDQIMSDIPRLGELMGKQISFASMKGRAHYVCQHRAEKARHNAKRMKLDINEQDQLDQLLAWESDGGSDLTQYENTPRERVRRLVTITGEDCKTKRRSGCEYNEEVDDMGHIVSPMRCHLLKARRRAMRSSIVVTNLDVLLYNYQLSGGLLGDFDVVIIDEAHELNAKVRDHFTAERTMSAFNKAADRLLELIDESRPRAGQTPQEYKSRIEEALLLANQTRELALDIRNGLMRFAVENAEANYRGDELEVLLHKGRTVSEILVHAERLLDVARKAIIVAVALGEIARIDENDTPPASDVREQAESLIEALKLEQGNFAHSVLIKPYNDPEHEPNVFVRSVPVDVGGYLRQTIYARATDEPMSPEDMAAGPSTVAPIVIAVSATLSPDGSWTHPRRQLAMPQDAVTCVVPSPFDYQKNAIWYTPAAMPEAWKRDDFNRAASAQAKELVQIVGGRTLILCSARKDMEVARDAIKHLGFPVYMQGDAPPKQLGNLFRQNKTSCMVGSRTFGTGFDAPGDALECVILWKLPFAKRSIVDEWLRKGQGDAQWRARYYLPAMLIDLRQWAGRLIRRTGDIGVIAIMDAEAVNGQYGKRVISSMPKGIRLVRSLPEVEGFLHRVRA